MVSCFTTASRIFDYTGLRSSLETDSSCRDYWLSELDEITLTLKDGGHVSEYEPAALTTVLSLPRLDEYHPSTGSANESGDLSHSEATIFLLPTLSTWSTLGDLE